MTIQPLDLSKSREIFREAQALIPGGVNSPARAFGAVGGEPIVIRRAEGAYLFDVDGHRYRDYIGSWGPMILGHAFPAVIDAVRQAAAEGLSYGAPTERENQLAQHIIEAVPSIEKVRLVNSGTEATMSAIRVARGYTGRDRIIKFAGNYHGHVDSLLVAAGSAAATLAAPDSPGVTEGASRDTLVLRFNDTDQLRDVFREHGDSLAAVILEPVVGNMGCVAGGTEFLRELRQLTEKHGVVLIFDEVMTGFRVAYGGAQERFGVRPDMTTLGKIVGGGMPLGAYGGRSEIMDHVLPVGKVFQAGTLSGNPVATAAGLATLEQLKRNPPYERLDQLTGQLEEGMRGAIQGQPASVQRVGSMITLFFHPGPIQSWDDASQCDTAAYGKFFWNMIHQGEYPPCSQYEAWFVSAAHTPEDIRATVESARAALAG